MRRIGHEITLLREGLTQAAHEIVDRLHQGVELQWLGAQRDRMQRLGAARSDFRRGLGQGPQAALERQRHQDSHQRKYGHGGPDQFGGCLARQGVALAGALRGLDDRVF